jgi:serine/threonine protein kinase
MSLNYPSKLKFQKTGVPIPNEASRDFSTLIQQIASGTSAPQDVYEAFKSAYGGSGYSSNASWAEHDMYGIMAQKKENAALYIDCFWTAVEDLRKQGLAVPDVERINQILDENQIPFSIQPPDLVMKTGDVLVTSSDVGAPAEGAHAFKRGEVIGRGGNGIVYRVTRTTSAGEFDFAMKVLDPSPFVQNRERAVARFYREMQALRKLQHRGIIQHLEGGLDFEGKPYILMPLIEGLDIRHALQGKTAKTVLGVFDELLFAIGYAHGGGVIHRDLKPSNILVRENDLQPIILDFGCAFLLDEADDHILTTSLIGTVAYMPIEVQRDRTIRRPTQDVYACGMILYETFAGFLPDPSDYQSLREVDSELGVVDTIVRTAIAPERKRFSSAEEMRAALHEAISAF